MERMRRPLIFSNLAMILLEGSSSESFRLLYLLIIFPPRQKAYYNRLLNTTPCLIFNFGIAVDRVEYVLLSG